MKAYQCARVINEWLTSSSHFARFECTGEVFPRGSTGRNSDLRECLARFGGRTFTAKFCCSVVRSLLLEFDYSPTRSRGESWHGYVERQAMKMKAFVRKSRCATRARVYRASKKYWQMDSAETQPMEPPVSWLKIDELRKVQINLDELAPSDPEAGKVQDCQAKDRFQALVHCSMGIVGVAGVVV